MYLTWTIMSIGDFFPVDILQVWRKKKALWWQAQDKANSLQRLARFLDRPLFPWKNLIVGFSIAQFVFEGFLSLRQYGVLKQTRPPKVLQNEVSQEVFDKSQVYHPAIIATYQQELILCRLTDVRKQSSVLFLVSTVKSKILPSSTTTFYPNSGRWPAHGSFDSHPLDSPARLPTPSSSSWPSLWSNRSFLCRHPSTILSCWKRNSALTSKHLNYSS
jgi:hypothetical protein